MGSFLLHFIKLWRTRIWLLLLAALAASLAFVPLFNLLAYEFCLALSLAGSIAAAHLGSVQVALTRRRDEGMLLALRGQRSALAALLARCVAANLLLLVLPLAIITLNALRVKNCDYLEGLAFFGMMPCLSVSIASCVGALWALTVPRSCLASAGALATISLSIAWGIWRFYDAPPIFGYDPFVGYFPGALYDQDVAIRTPFLVYRLYNMVWLAAAVLVAGHLFDPSAIRLRRGCWRPHRILSSATLLALLCGTILFWQRAPLGFAVDAEQIGRELGGLRHTTHFDIYHPVELDPDEVELLAQDHEFRHAQLSALFGRTPGRITSYIFNDEKQKQRLMGAGHTFVAKPWRREVYLQQGGFPHRVLKHELAHVFAGLHGDDWFKISLRWRGSPVPHPLFNVGLIEGLAVAADWRPYEEMTGHQMAAALVRIGLAPPPESLFGHGFLSSAASRSYILSGSFCRYLLQQQGLTKLGAAYRSGGDFKASYGRSLDDLLQEWSRWLEDVDLPPLQLQLAEERFRRPSVLKRVCSHEVANLLEEAYALSTRRQHDQAAQIYERVCTFDSSEPTHLLAWMRSTAEAGRIDQALEIGSRLLRHPSLSKPLQRRTLEVMGDLHWTREDRVAAVRFYQRAGKLAAGPPGRRVLHLKRWALRQPEQIQVLVRRYLVPPPGQQREAGLDVHIAHSLRRRLPGSGLGLFLVGKQLSARRHCHEAATALEESIRAGLPDADFEIEAHRVLGRCQVINRALEQAERTFTSLLDRTDLAAGARLETMDWLDRIRWRRSGTATGRFTTITPMIPKEIVNAKTD